ncbi:MAG: response regulator [Dehalococcoidales bacterium]|nr:response regulator [Dehalococcoidales bacterium]
MNDTESDAERAGTTVLIIEDEADIREFISRVVELEGYRVLKAADGKTGLDLLREHRVMLILLDLRLPGLDGWTILRDIKNDPAFSHIPVIVLTAIAETMQRKRTIKMGASKYLVKPLSANRLSTAITAILAERSV